MGGRGAWAALSPFGCGGSPMKNSHRYNMKREGPFGQCRASTSQGGAQSTSAAGHACLRILSTGSAYRQAGGIVNGGLQASAHMKGADGARCNNDLE